MIVTLWFILFILLVVAFTYPEEFPTMVRNPDQLLQVLGLEVRRRWMILKFGSILWVEKQKLRYSLWKAQPIIKAEREKQHLKEENNID
jgi:hypothetical protein